MVNPNEQMVDPMTGMPMQTTMIPPAPSNTLGQAQPVFNDSVQTAAQSIYGDVQQRQTSVGDRAPLFPL
jgi:hypothetical protein